MPRAERDRHESKSAKARETVGATARTSKAREAPAADRAPGGAPSASGSKRAREVTGATEESEKSRVSKKAAKKVAGSYEKPKTHGGKRYTGMAVGRTHTWNYDSGFWKEKKVEPDRWEFAYEVPKRRKGKAPEGSGAPVDTEYHWLIVAHQRVKKLDANTYSTRMEGEKYKLAHKRATSEEWSVKTAKGEQRRMLKILEDAADRLRAELEDGAAREEPAPPAAAHARELVAAKGGAKKRGEPRGKKENASKAPGQQRFEVDEEP